MSAVVTITVEIGDIPAEGDEKSPLPVIIAADVKGTRDSVFLRPLAHQWVQFLAAHVHSDLSLAGFGLDEVRGADRGDEPSLQ